MTHEKCTHFCDKINLGASFLDARAVRIMNKPKNQEKDVDEVDEDGIRS